MKYALSILLWMALPLAHSQSLNLADFAVPGNTIEQTAGLLNGCCVTYDSLIVDGYPVFQLHTKAGEAIALLFTAEQHKLAIINHVIAVPDMNAARDLFRAFESKYYRKFEILNIHELLLNNAFPYKAKGFWEISGGRIEVFWGNAGPQSQDNFFVGEKVVMTKYRD